MGEGLSPTMWTTFRHRDRPTDPNPDFARNRLGDYPCGGAALPLKSHLSPSFPRFGPRYPRIFPQLIHRIVVRGKVAHYAKQSGRGRLAVHSLGTQRRRPEVLIWKARPNPPGRQSPTICQAVHCQVLICQVLICQAPNRQAPIPAHRLLPRPAAARALVMTACRVIANRPTAKRPNRPCWVR